MLSKQVDDGRADNQGGGQLQRQLGLGPLQEARDQLPRGVTPSMGPISTGLGEIYLWTVEARPGAKKPRSSSSAPACRASAPPSPGDSTTTASTAPQSMAR